MRTFEEIGFQASAAWKRFISIFKTEWRIEDYPIHVRFHSVAETPQASRLKTFPWTATVINWPGMLGGGETRQEALEDLRKKFEQFKATNEVWPRPGVKVPVKFAANTRIERHAELAEDFVKRVLGIAASARRRPSSSAMGRPVIPPLKMLARRLFVPPSAFPRIHPDFFVRDLPPRTVRGCRVNH